jgi:hypothetical protein
VASARSASVGEDVARLRREPCGRALAIKFGLGSERGPHVCHIFVG